MDQINDVPSQKQESSARLYQVQKDLKIALKEFPRESTGIKVLADKMGVHTRTLKRILKGTHTPSYQTILKIYRYFLGSKSDRETILKAPHLLGEYLLNEKENFSLANEDADFSTEIDILLNTDSVFRSIYIETATGNVTKERIGYMHGQMGIKVLEYMKDLGVIEEFEEGIFKSSTNRASLQTETLYSLSNFLISNHFYTEKAALAGENGLTVFTEGLNKDAYNELLKIDWEAKQKKIQVLKNPKNKGEIKAWSVTITDTLSPELIYKEDTEEEGLQ